jgi:hypothetical protein
MESDTAFYLPESFAGVASYCFVIMHPGMPVVGIDAGLLDRIEAVDSEIAFIIEDADFEVRMNIDDGPEGARRIAEHLAPYTRRAPITSASVYADAKARIGERSAGGAIRHY